MRVVIANFGPPSGGPHTTGWWDHARLPARPQERLSLFDQPTMWGFHLTAMGVLLMDRGEATEVEFWDYGPERSVQYDAAGVLRVILHDEEDALAYLARTRPVDLFVNYGIHGSALLARLSDIFRVHVPTVRNADSPLPPAECYLLDAEDQLVDRSMLYMPVVNTERFTAATEPPVRDLVYAATDHPAKRHDILIDALRGTEITGHLHPVPAGRFDLAGTRLTSSAWDERDVPELLRSSRLAVYPGDETSNPAAMWECLAADVPIIVNEGIAGGRHVVVPGVTGEFATADTLVKVIEQVLADRANYSPRRHLLENWGTVRTIDRYLDFFGEMGWTG
jgi:glycosyltransferase involved in cell wall biosynthesis